MRSVRGADSLMIAGELVDARVCVSRCLRTVRSPVLRYCLIAMPYRIEGSTHGNCFINTGE